MRPLIIIGMARDAHCVRVGRRIAESGGRVFLFDPTVAWPLTYDFARPAICAMPIRSKGEYVFARPELVPLAGAVVWRRLKLSFDFFESTEKQELYYYSREALTVLEAAIVQSDCIEFNAPSASRLAANKILQISVAKRVGMAVPETRFTNERRVVSALEAQSDSTQIIGKALKTAFIPPTIGNGADARLIHTTPVKARDLSDPKAIHEAVAIYQKRIPKDYELRVVVFGREHHAFSIHPPESEDGKLDWRLTQWENTHSYIGQLNELGCVSEYINEFRLHYGVFDFIRTPNGEVVFLECNPDGQWGWLEEETGETVISDMFTRSICELMGVADAARPLGRDGYHSGIHTRS